MNLLRLLNLRRNEVPRLLQAGLIFFLVSVNDGIIKSVAAAVFNIRQGVEHLPLMYTWIAVLFAVLMGVLSWLTARISRQALLFGLLFFVELVLALNVAGLLLELRGALPVWARSLYYPFLFVSSELGRSLVGFHIWIVAGCICYASRAKVLFPLLAAAATLGDISGGFAVRLLGELLTSYQLYGIAVVNLAVIIALLRPLVRRYFVAPEESNEAASLGENLRYLGGSSYLLLLFVLSVAVFALYTSVHYGFNVVGREFYPSEGDFTRFFGLFYGCAGLATLLATTLLLQRLLRWVGTGSIYLWVCVVYAGVALLLTSVFQGWVPLPRVGAVFGLNLVSFLLLDSVIAPTYQVMIKMVPARNSDGTRMIMEGGFMLLGGLCGAGMTALHAHGVLSLSGLFALLSGLSAAMVGCGWLLRRSYTQVLVRAVREQDIDVDDEQAMATLNRTLASSTELTRDLLLHRDDGVRQMGIEIMHKHPGPWIAQVCHPLLEHANPRIRSAALAALTPEGRAADTGTRILALLDDDNAEVRLSAARALARLTGPTPGATAITGSQREEVIQAVLPRLQHGSSQEVAQFLITLRQLQYDDAVALGERLLEQMLSSDSSTEQLAGLEAATWIEAPEMRHGAERLRESPEPAVREAVAAYLGCLHDRESSEMLVAMLSDPDPDVVDQAVRTLARSASDELLDTLQQRLGVCPLTEWAALMRVFMQREDSALEPVVTRSARERLVQASDFIVAVSRIQTASSGDAARLLVAQLWSQALIVRDTAVRVLGFVADEGVVSDLLDRLTSGDEAARDSAVELLENLADRDLLRYLLPLLEDETETRLLMAQEISHWQDPSVRDVLRELLAGVEPWTQLAAMWTAREVGMDDLLRHPPENLPQSMWASGIERQCGRGNAMSDQELPLTTMEKITFLRESEFFAALPLEELYHIALSMQEESVAPGSRIIEEGTRGDKMYIVVSGRLEVCRADGQRVAVLTEKQVFGDMALLDDEPRSASVVALEAVHLLSLQRSSLERILRRYASIAFNMMRILSQRLRASMAGTN